MSLTFDNPRALFLLLLLPLFYLVGRFSHSFISPSVRTTAIVVRLLLIAAVVLAISQPVLQRASDVLSTIFVVDRSASVEFKGANSTSAWLQQALAAQGPNDRVGVVDFASSATVRQALGTDQPVANEPTLDPRETNLAAGLHLATSLFPTQGAQRIVVLSDGQTTTDDAVAEAHQDSTRTVQIDVAPIGPPPSFHEVLVDSFSAPPSVRIGQPFDLTVVVQSTAQTTGALQITMDGRSISHGTVQLKPGPNEFSVNVASATKGFHSFEATIQSPMGTYPENKSDFTFTVVGDSANIAVVASSPQEAAPITAALGAAKMTVTAIAPTAIPPNPAALDSFAGMVLVDTPASAFTIDQMKTITGFVHDLGRGLLVIGGPHSYGLGKYDGTALGDAMPVTGGVPGNVQNGNDALVLVIDKSGSMSLPMGGVQKMIAADEAAKLAIGSLGPNDEIGVESFNTDTSWVVPLQKVGNAAHQQQLESIVTQIQADGGTDIYAGLKDAYQAIHPSAAQYKHIILMSDGYSFGDSDYTQLLQNISNEKITLSTIAIGDDVDKNLLQMLATKGGGSYYATNDASQIPAITTKESRVVRGSGSVVETFQPAVVAPDPLLSAIRGSDLPQLSGYTVTTPRKDATVALQSDRQDPILTHWNYGLGRVVAWTSDLSPQGWGASWLNWNDFSQFWAQVMNWSVPPPGDPGLQLASSVSGNNASLQVDAVGGNGSYQDLLDLRAQVTGANGQLVQVPLVQTKSGHYEATFSMPQEGAYPVEVDQYDSNNKVVRSALTGIVMPYPAEYHAFGVNQEELAAVAATTGGTVLHSPTESFDRTGLTFAGQSRTPLWPLLLTIAAILFPLDVVVRRLRLDPGKVVAQGWNQGRGLASVCAAWVSSRVEWLVQLLPGSVGPTS